MGGNDFYTGGVLFSSFAECPLYWELGYDEKHRSFSHVLTCFCTSFLVVLLAMACLIFAVRLGLVTWRHCKRPLEASETLDPSGTVA